MSTLKQSINIGGDKYVLKRKIEIKYKRPTLFSGPKIKLERYHSFTPFFESKNEYIEFIGYLGNLLNETYYPIWLWFLIFILSLGLLAWILIPFQKKLTVKKGIELENYVKTTNEKLKKKIEQNTLLLFEIPFPSKNKVILHGCFYEKVLGTKH